MGKTPNPCGIHVSTDVMRSLAPDILKSIMRRIFRAASTPWHSGFAKRGVKGAVANSSGANGFGCVM